MRKAFIALVLLMACVALGCASAKPKAEKPVTGKTVIKCPYCKATFQVEEGLYESGR